MLKLDNQMLLTIFVAITGLAVIMQAFILLGIYLVIRRTARSLHEQAEAFRSGWLPVLNSTREVLARVAPRVEGVVNDIAFISQGLKAQSAAAQGSLTEILERLKSLILRIDFMLTGVLNNVDRAGRFVNETVARPVRRFSGIMAAARAVIDVLRTSTQSRHAAGRKE